MALEFLLIVSIEVNRGMKTEGFTFAVFAFNSEDTILETLESIKYQVISYGTSVDNFLLISDDCSTDNTLRIAENWVNVNKKLWKGVRLLSSPYNNGLCSNYAKVIPQIKTSSFLLLAADDLVSCNNIYDSFEGLQDNEIRIHVPLFYDGERVYLEDAYFTRHLFFFKSKHSNLRDRRLLEILTPYVSPEIAINGNLYSKECLEYICQYRNYEDDTSFYYILKHNKKVKFSFVMQPLVLYRKSKGSLLTSVDTFHQIRFLDDLYMFKKQLFLEETNIIIKLFLLLGVWHCFLMKHRFDAKKTLYMRIVDIINSTIAKKAREREDYLDYRKQLSNCLVKENDYILRIKERLNRDM